MERTVTVARTIVMERTVVVARTIAVTERTVTATVARTVAAAAGMVVSLPIPTLRGEVLSGESLNLRDSGLQRWRPIANRGCQGKQMCMGYLPFDLP